MGCQKICPENKKSQKNIETGVHFTKSETELILAGIEFKNLPEAAKIKLTELCMNDYYNVLPRNLNLLININE